jgi:mycofactocin precursor
MDRDTPETPIDKKATEPPQVIDEIVIEELSIDGVCGVY